MTNVSNKTKASKKRKADEEISINDIFEPNSVVQHGMRKEMKTLKGKRSIANSDESEDESKIEINQTKKNENTTKTVKSVEKKATIEQKKTENKPNPSNKKPAGRSNWRKEVYYEKWSSDSD